VIETEVEPPLPDLDDDEDDGPEGIGAYVTIGEPDGTRRGAAGVVPPDSGDDRIAEMLVGAMLAAADLRGPGLRQAVVTRMAERVQ